MDFSVSFSTFPDRDHRLQYHPVPWTSLSAFPPFPSDTTDFSTVLFPGLLCQLFHLSRLTPLTSVPSCSLDFSVSFSTFPDRDHRLQYRPVPWTSLSAFPPFPTGTTDFSTVLFPELLCQLFHLSRLTPLTSVPSCSMDFSVSFSTFPDRDHRLQYRPVPWTSLSAFPPFPTGTTDFSTILFPGLLCQLFHLSPPGPPTLVPSCSLDFSVSFSTFPV